MRTPAFPPGNGSDYANATLLVSYQGSPADLLEVLHGVENAMGRERKTRWGARVLDLDLLAVGDGILPSREILSRWMGLDLEAQRREMPDELILPHPRLQDRAFVLVPLAEIAPDWTHPILGLTVRQMLDALDPRDVASVVPYE